MAINNRNEWLAQWSEFGIVVTDHLYFGQNRLVPLGTYTPDPEGIKVDTVTFVGTAGRDTLLGGGGEFASIFVGTRGADLYGGGNTLFDDQFSFGVVDYSAAHSRVVVDMDYRGSRTFTDETGEVRTVSILGRALKDGFGGQDDFMEDAGLFGGPSFSSVTTVIGSRFGDWMVGSTYDGLHGGRGNDYLEGNSLSGGEGNDRLIGRATGHFEFAAAGDEGNDLIIGTDFVDFRLSGGAGDDWIFGRGGVDPRGDLFRENLFGGDGDDLIDGGEGGDRIHGGDGADVLLSGAGNDVFDYEFRTDPDDDARDIIRVTRADLGAYRDEVFLGLFEEGVDQIRFRDAVRGGLDFKIYQEEIATIPGRVNTILQIDWNDNGFGGDLPETQDYFLVVRGADLSQHDGFLLT